MTEEDWNASWGRCIGMLLGGEALNEVDENGEPVIDDTLLIVFNSHIEPVQFLLPRSDEGIKWEVLINTNFSDPATAYSMGNGVKSIEVSGRSIVALRQVKF